MAESHLVTSALGFEYCELSVMAYWDTWIVMKEGDHPCSSYYDRLYESSPEYVHCRTYVMKNIHNDKQ